MSPYIQNLTNNLIGKNGYDRLGLHPSELVKHIKFDLEVGDVSKMNPETLGKIMAAFDNGDVMASKSELFNLVSFSGDCGDFLRELVSACLAMTIRDRLQETHLPPYSPHHGEIRKAKSGSWSEYHRLKATGDDRAIDYGATYACTWCGHLHCVCEVCQNCGKSEAGECRCH
ncbi:MAG: hypothetical protein WAU28_01035 [Candidatus Moraniibacteriota bacterium]